MGPFGAPLWDPRAHPLEACGLLLESCLLVVGNLFDVHCNLFVQSLVDKGEAKKRERKGKGGKEREREGQEGKGRDRK